VTTYGPNEIRAAASTLLAALPERAWLPHGLVRKPNGDLDKPPMEGARTNTPATWFTLDGALDKFVNVKDVAGIGFAITSGIIALDFDKCRDPYTGILDDEIQTELELFGSYAYVTPSGRGIRIVGLNDPALPIPGAKHNRWLPGGHKVEIFVGPVNFYNTFTASKIDGYDDLKDISDLVLDRLQGLDDGRKGTNGSTQFLASAEPQRSIAAIRAALAIIPNKRKDWDEWSRIGMAVWRSSGGKGEGLDAWIEWSARADCHDLEACNERWQHWFISPPTKIGFGTLYHEARKIKSLFVPPFDPIPHVHQHDSTPRTAEAPEPRKILSMRELDALPPPEWLVQGLIPEKSLVVPFGPPKSGKTFIVLSFSLHIAAGKAWFGYPVKRGGVVYIAGEGTGGLSQRLKAMRAHYDISIDEPFWTVPRAVNFRVEGEVEALVTLIRATIGDTPLRLVVIDTLARAMPGADENSAQEVGLVIAGCDRLRDALGCTTLPVHHSGKDAGRGARGTSALRGAWDAAFEITNSGKRVVMSVVDQKEAEAGQRLVFRMEEVATGIGRQSLVPVLNDTDETDETAGKAAYQRPVTGQAGMALQILRNLMVGPESAILPPFADLPSGDVRGISHLAFRRAFYEKMPGEDQAKRKLAFWRAVQTLIQKELIGVKDPWVWLV
jgi:hypothetical protein